MKDEWYINNFATIKICAVIRSRVISLKFIELCMETLCWCYSEGHKHGGREVAQTSVIAFSYQSENLLLYKLILVLDKEMFS